VVFLCAKVHPSLSRKENLLLRITASFLQLVISKLMYDHYRYVISVSNSTYQRLKQTPCPLVWGFVIFHAAAPTHEEKCRGIGTDTVPSIKELVKNKWNFDLVLFAP
jgi:hypothetical protein